MNDAAPAPDPAEPAPDQVPRSAGTNGEVPAEAHLEAIAQDAHVRRAPKLRAFVAVGGAIGAIAGVVLTRVVTPQDPAAAGNVGVTTFFVAVILATVGVVAGAAVALWADRRSRTGAGR